MRGCKLILACQRVIGKSWHALCNARAGVPLNSAPQALTKAVPTFSTTYAGRKEQNVNKKIHYFATLCLQSATHHVTLLKEQNLMKVISVWN